MRKVTQKTRALISDGVHAARERELAEQLDAYERIDDFDVSAFKAKFKQDDSITLSIYQPIDVAMPLRKGKGHHEQE